MGAFDSLHRTVLRRVNRSRCGSEALVQLWHGGSSDDHLLAVDLETTGLDPRTDHIISMGWVAIDRGRIRLASARHLLVRSHKPMNQSATIHGLTDSDLEDGMDLAHALDALFQALEGRTLLVHGAQLDMGMLDQGCREQFGVPLLMPCIDTLDIARRRLERRNEPIRHGALRLMNLRKNLGLPPVSSHNALVDALATAELYLALSARH
ncbi:MAG: exonuclease domain-containing protein [Xanthomonadales bacterium]|nr:exonuclease domain-containing protein [Xanthomonadales bacterium]